MDSVNPVEVTSLVVSVFTLIVLANLLFAVATAQIMYSLAYLPRWDRRTLGGWANFARRRMRWSDMRIENVFEVPFIFLSPADNNWGPLPGRDIIYIDGTTESCERTRVRLSRDREDAIDEKYVTSRVRLGRSVERHSDQRANRRYKDVVPVVANERVTWVPLLEALQEMERDSTNWEARVWRRPELVDVTSLVAGIQIGRRVLDPTSVIKKPYATTNMASIVALAAVLGIYWKQFDRDQDVYRAEGNNFVLRGSRIPHFGLAFVFEKTGSPEFNERRLIPTSAVHELCFGRVPTIYRDAYSHDPTLDRALGTGKSKKPSFIQTLRLGSSRDIAATLTQIGCNKRTACAHSTRGDDDQILLPLPFQMTAMLGQVLYVKNRCFTYIPNPTTTPWPKYLIALRPMLSTLCEQPLYTLSEFRKPRDLELLEGIILRLERELPSQDQHFTPPEMALLYDSLTRLDNILMNAGGKLVLDIVRRHIEASIEENHFSDGHLKKVDLVDLVPPEDAARVFVANSFIVIRKRAVELEEGLKPRAAPVSPVSLARPQRDFDISKASQDSSFGSNMPNVESLHDVPYDLMLDKIQRDIVWCTLFTRMLCWLLLHNFDENDVQVPKSELMGSKEEVHIL